MNNNPCEFFAHKHIICPYTQYTILFYCAVEKLEFKSVKLQVGKVPVLIQKDFFSKLSENIDSQIRTAHKFFGEQENDLNGKI